MEGNDRHDGDFDCSRKSSFAQRYPHVLFGIWNLYCLWQSGYPDTGCDSNRKMEEKAGKSKFFRFFYVFCLTYLVLRCILK